MRHPVLGFILFAAVLGAGCADGGDVPPGYAAASAVRGGLLYDKWWAVPGSRTSTEPVADNPGYTRTEGTQTGSVTWRCKECHGWDYKGAGGAYASGSHRTGVKGLLDESGEDPFELFDAIHGGRQGTAMTAMGEFLSEQDLWDLVKFIREGTVDLDTVIDRSTKQALVADPHAGRARYDNTCAACHGADGKTLNFGSIEEPEYVQHIAQDNPWEFQHKVRFGQPGEEMPSAEASGWTMQDVMDVMAYVRTLPL